MRNKYSVNWEQKRMDEMKTLLAGVLPVYHDQEKVKNGDEVEGRGTPEDFIENAQCLWDRPQAR